MSVKIGDKVLVTPSDFGVEQCCRDCTKGEQYEVIHVGRGHGQAGGETSADVQFIDDVGDKVIVHQCDVTKV